MFRFKCVGCGDWHDGMPAFHTHAPLSYDAVPADEREARCFLDTDVCVVDGQFFFVHACLEIPVHGETEPFVWGAWVSLSQDHFDTFLDCFESPKRRHIGPFFGWLNAELPLYPSTMNLKTLVHLRDDGIRPSIELEPIDHPLAIEQREGIDVPRVAEIYAHFERQWR